MYVILHKIYMKTIVTRKYLSKKLDYLLHISYNVLTDITIGAKTDGL